MWSSPISYEAKEFAKIVRETLEKLNFVFVRDTTSKSYSRFVVMIPMMGGAHVYRYSVEYPARFVIMCYDTFPGTKTGRMPFFEIENVDERNRETISKLLKEIVSAIARPPWEFTTGQRLMVGYLLPEFRQARKSWAKFGFDTSTKTSRLRKKEVKQGRAERRKEMKQRAQEHKGDGGGGLQGKAEETGDQEGKGVEEDEGKGKEEKEGDTEPREIQGRVGEEIGEDQ